METLPLVQAIFFFFFSEAERAFCIPPAESSAGEGSPRGGSLCLGGTARPLLYSRPCCNRTVPRVPRVRIEIAVRAGIASSLRSLPSSRPSVKVGWDWETSDAAANKPSPLPRLKSGGSLYYPPVPELRSPGWMEAAGAAISTSDAGWPIRPPILPRLCAGFFAAPVSEEQPARQ